MLEWGGTLVQIARDPQTNSEVTGGRVARAGAGAGLCQRQPGRKEVTT